MTEENGSRYWEIGDSVYAVNVLPNDDYKTFYTTIECGRVEDIDKYGAVRIKFSKKRSCGREWAESTRLFPTESEARAFIEKLKSSGTE